MLSIHFFFYSMKNSKHHCYFVFIQVVFISFFKHECKHEFWTRGWAKILTCFGAGGPSSGKARPRDMLYVMSFDWGILIRSRACCLVTSRATLFDFEKKNSWKNSFFLICWQFHDTLLLKFLSGKNEFHVHMTFLHIYLFMILYT